LSESPTYPPELVGLTWDNVKIITDTDGVPLSGEISITHQCYYLYKKGRTEDRLVTIAPKSRHGIRTISIPTKGESGHDLLRTLHDHRRQQQQRTASFQGRWKNNNLVFPDSLGGYLKFRNLILRDFNPLIERVGLPRVRFHSLRHFAITRLVHEGTDIKTVQEIGGHHDPAFTLRQYVHGDNNSKLAAMAKVGQSL
jgi:integrase